MKLAFRKPTRRGTVIGLRIATGVITTVVGVGGVTSFAAAGFSRLDDPSPSSSQADSRYDDLPTVSSGTITGRHTEFVGNILVYYLDLRSCDSSGESCTDGKTEVNQPTYRGYEVGARYPSGSPSGP